MKTIVKSASFKKNITNNITKFPVEVEFLPYWILHLICSSSFYLIQSCVLSEAFLTDLSLSQVHSWLDSTLSGYQQDLF